MARLNREHSDRAIPQLEELLKNSNLLDRQHPEVAIPQLEQYIRSYGGDATALASDILAGVTAYVGLKKVTGTMPNIGDYDATIDEKDEVVSIPLGYHNGNGTVSIDSDEQDKITARNIRDGVSILGTLGDFGTYQSKTVSQSLVDQIVEPDPGYDFLSQVKVNKTIVQAKTVSQSLSDQVVTPDPGYDYLSQVTVNKTIVQEKTVPPAVTDQVILPDNGYDYLSKVTVLRCWDIYYTLQDDGGYDLLDENDNLILIKTEE